VVDLIEFSQSNVGDEYFQISGVSLDRVRRYVAFTQGTQKLFA
jgi:hypothetical protein